MLKSNEIAKSFVQTGIQKTSMPTSKMFVLGIFAGAGSTIDSSRFVFRTISSYNGRCSSIQSRPSL